MVCDSVLAIAAVLLVAFWLGLALDYLPVQLGGTEMPRLARTLATLAAAMCLLDMAAGSELSAAAERGRRWARKRDESSDEPSEEAS